MPLYKFRIHCRRNLSRVAIGPWVVNEELCNLEQSFQRVCQVGDRTGIGDDPSCESRKLRANPNCCIASGRKVRLPSAQSQKIIEGIDGDAVGEQVVSEVA